VTIRILKETVETTTKVERSTFICQLVPATTVEAAKAALARRVAEHRRATHNCWAYVVGLDERTKHSSDAGEPSGSAGRPMLNALESSGLTNVLAVVTRYFGGVKLGVRGLIDAYGSSVTTTVEAAEAGGLVDAFVPSKRYELTVEYGLVDRVLHRAGEVGAKQVDAAYGAQVVFLFEVPDEAAADWEDYAERLQQTSGSRWRQVTE